MFPRLPISIGLLSAFLLAPGVGLATEFDFNRDIRPILSDKCFQCHGPDSAHREAGLRLDEEDAAKADLGGYRAIDIDTPDQSEALLRIDSDDESMVMPPPEVHKPFSDEERKTLRDWIEAGAGWSVAWAYVAPQRTDPPEVAETDWPANWIDPFVLSQLEAAGVDHAADADPVTLVRRVSFDLTGLPPTTEMVEAFIAEPSEAAYEAMVDRLLASPRFGERMAMYWLDLVRFADTVGYHGDQVHGVWPYRDYVIHAFNENKPFDEFTAEQLAGDLLPDSTEDDKIASAYNRLLQTSHEGGVQLKEYRAIYLADRVRNVSQVWMGATMGCCQCHDHKFDPLPAAEFYSLGAFFADIDDEEHLRTQYKPGRNQNPTQRLPELPVRSVYQRQRLDRLDAALEAFDPEEDGELLATLRTQRERLATPTSTVISEPSEPRTVRIQNRGDWQDESGEIVEPGAPGILGWRANGEGRASRLDLAQWLTDADEGAGLLTARVMANRFWFLMFGEGLARVLDDFGGQGEAPTHPWLLDNLAVEFARSDWDVKHTLKLIAMSRTYRQASTHPTPVATAELLARDPDNRLLARQGRFRLPAEMVRDASLAASGLLIHQLGGPSVKPYQPDGYYQHLNFPIRKYEADTDASQWRRGLYVHWQRQFLHPTMKALDAPRREECTAKRPHSNTPLASLALLNDPSFVEAARVFAAEILRDASDDRGQRVDAIYLRAVSRSADEFEREQLGQLVDAQLAYYTEHPEEADALLGVGLKTAAEEIEKPELAAWTFACRAVLNLSETITRN